MGCAKLTSGQVFAIALNIYDRFSISTAPASLHSGQVLAGILTLAIRVYLARQERGILSQSTVQQSNSARLVNFLDKVG